ncbi:MAG: hypothetical protein ACYC65_04490, partial [Candidatus Limnocylindrales bacterium]
MTTPDPVDPMRDDSPTTPVDLPPFPPVPPVPPAAGTTPSADGPAPWDVPGPIPPTGAWGASAGPAPAPGPGPAPSGQTSWAPGTGYAAPPSWTVNAPPPPHE